MGKHFGLLVFTTIIVSGSVAIFSFGDFLITTFAPGSTFANTIKASEYGGLSVIVTEEDVYESNYVENALLDLYKNAIVINKYNEIEIGENTFLNDKEKNSIEESLSLPKLNQPIWFPENIFITIDDGPRLSNGSLQNILKVLDEHKVQAYFFFVGDNIKANLNRNEDETISTLTSMVQSGHQIGWHSMRHTHMGTILKPRLDQKGPDAVKEDIFEFSELLDETLGFPYKIKTGRMPGGSGTYDQDIIETFRDLGIRPPTFWHIETEPWQEQVAGNLTAYVSNILKKKDDYIVLLHEYTRTANDLDEFLTEIKKQSDNNTNVEIITKRQTQNDACPKPTMQFDLDLEPMSRTHSIPASYAPSSLVLIKGDWSDYCIKSDTEKALQRMISDAKVEGLDIQIYSGYRSHSLQSSLFSRWQRNNPNGAEYPAVAEPGHSEHQLGTTVDLKSGALPYGDDNPFGDSPEYPWMQENAHRYGFTQSYKEGAEQVTGYIAEPWHWRYVGVDLATEIKNKDITLTEYFNEL